MQKLFKLSYKKYLLLSLLLVFVVACSNRFFLSEHSIKLNEEYAKSNLRAEIFQKIDSIASSPIEAHRYKNLLDINFSLIISEHIQENSITNLLKAARNKAISSDKTNAKAMTDEILSALYDELDEFSDWYDDERMKEFNLEISGSFVGIGVSFRPVEEGALITEVFENSPAEKEGIKKDDIIISADGVSLYGASSQKVVDLIKGENNTYVNLEVKRANKVTKMRIKRKKVEVPDVRLTYYDDVKAFHIQVSEFNQKTAAHLQTELEKVKQDESIIIDLRNNPGGLLDVALHVADMILNKGDVITSIRVNSKNNITHKAYKKPMINNQRVVVLINEGSASASELVAAAVQEHKDAVLLGRQSYGKGSVQALNSFLPYGGAMLTYAIYETPSNKILHGRGIMPDVFVNVNGFEVKKPKELKGLAANTLLNANITIEENEVNNICTSYVDNDADLNCALTLIKNGNLKGMQYQDMLGAN